MITKDIVEESYNRILNDNYHLVFIPPYNPESWKEHFSNDEWATVIDIIGDDFLTVDSYEWTNKERLQMETVIDICANVLDI